MTVQFFWLVKFYWNMRLSDFVWFCGELWQNWINMFWNDVYAWPLMHDIIKDEGCVFKNIATIGNFIWNLIFATLYVLSMWLVYLKQPSLFSTEKMSCSSLTCPFCLAQINYFMFWELEVYFYLYMIIYRPRVENFFYVPKMYCAIRQVAFIWYIHYGESLVFILIDCTRILGMCHAFWWYPSALWWIS